MADWEDDSTPKTVHLASSRDWKLWYSFILDAAIYAEVEDFVDITKPEHARDVKKPKMPELAAFTMEAKFDWDVKMAMWKVKLAEYNTMKRGMERINALIWRTVSADQMRHRPTGSNVDVKDVIKALEARLSPSISSLRLDVRERYAFLCQRPTNRGIETWLNQWALIEEDIKDAGITGNFNLKMDFINANISIDSGYAQVWAKDLHRDGDSITLTSMINDFRQRYTEVGVIKSHLNANFATVNGRQAGRSVNRECTRGGRQLNLQSIQTAVQRITISVVKQREYLRDSWIYDTGAEQHVCNNRSRSLPFKPAYAEVYTGDSFTRVEGYGSVLTYMINVAI
ncbi:hypothetical protein AJ78_01369 [Emergomyces pasteurianus Ep9510]|uniref:Uncharacterized protein n=1 Tax=Emergomyces pasteurianus Ep9510 TaxID=1447872 RepID=A0A1J9PQW0_9EURO|nr:hypothetical protein AJ78_01369 [Emergomyces pasteurianus Ep9510]